MDVDFKTDETLDICLEICVHHPPICGSMRSACCKPALGVEGGHAAGACSSDGLAVVSIHHIAATKNTLDVGRGSKVRHRLEQTGRRLDADPVRSYWKTGRCRRPI